MPVEAECAGAGFRSPSHCKKKFPTLLDLSCSEATDKTRLAWQSDCNTSRGETSPHIGGLNMIWNYKLVRNAVLSLVMAGGMAGFTTLAQAHSYTKSEMRSAQQLLKNCGYYSGKVNGKSGRTTKAAIRKYQRANNLTVNGHLDWHTRRMLGVKKSA
jgi:hypothetical protein